MIATQIPFVNVNIADTNIKLTNLIVGGMWDFEALYTVFSNQYRYILKQILPTVRLNHEDAWIWSSSPTEMYTAKVAYG